MSERVAAPGELCTCGRQAVVVFLSRPDDPVGHCGLNNGGAPAGGHCPFCKNELRHDADGVRGPILQGARCPRYRLRLDDPVPALWWCEAYGPPREGVPAERWPRCFLSPEIGQRRCEVPTVCADVMASERSRVFARINELAVAGGEHADVYRYLADEIGCGPSPRPAPALLPHRPRAALSRARPTRKGARTMGGEAKSSARRVSAKIRQDRALALRIAGATFDQIAKTPLGPDDPRTLYSSRQRAHEAVHKALRELAAEAEGKTKELRALELQRLESMQVSLWPSTRPTREVRCENPDCRWVLYREVDQGAVDRVLKIMERRSKYQGLDAADENEDRMVAVLEHQVSLAQQAMVTAMEKAGLPPAKQREVLEYAAEILREVDETA